MADLRLCSVSDCGKPHNCKGFCKKHYARFAKYGDALFTKVRPGGYAQEFFEFARLYDGKDCLIWPYGGTKGGYAHVWFDGKTCSVTRLLCAEEHGPPPPKTHAAHSCGKGHLGCVNRHHLSWKTVKENSADKIEHGTMRRGSENGNSKLTEAEAMDILSSEGIPQKELAKRYNITQAMVSSIKRRKAWKYLPETSFSR